MVEAPSKPTWWHNKHADKAVEFFERLTLCGSYSGEKMKLAPFQESIIRELFGKRDEHDRMMVDTVELWMPKGAGKSIIIALLVIYMMACGPPGQEIYCLSADKKKAGKIFEYMHQVICQDKHLRRYFDTTEHIKQIKVRQLFSTFQALANSDAIGDSLAPSLCIFEELHLFKNSVNFSTLRSGMVKRKTGQSLEIRISTAGNRRSGFAYELYQNAKALEKGDIKNERHLVRIFESYDEWTDPETFYKANPALFVNRDKVLAKIEEAKQIPRLKWEYLQYHLNQWTEESTELAIPREAWERCEEQYTEADMAGQKCYVGCDLSQLTTDHCDLTSMALFFPDTNRVLSYSWLPAKGLHERDKREGVDYKNWEQSGILRTVHHDRNVFKQVADDINQILKGFEVVKVLIDPFAINLIREFLDCELSEYRPVAPMYSPPLKWLEASIVAGELRHNGNPILSMCALNTVFGDANGGLIFPSKELSRKKIDAFCALVFAIGGWRGSEPEPEQIEWSLKDCFVDLTPKKEDASKATI